MSDESFNSAVAPPMPEVAPPPVPMTPPGRARRGAVVLAAVVGLVVGAAGVGLAWGLSASGGDSASASFTLTGEMTLTGDHIPVGGTSLDCAGYGGYDDIAEGSSVTVYDAAGQVVATGALGLGKPQDGDGGPCVFPVRVPSVPEGSKFYGVEVSHRGKITISAADARAGAFAATLG